MGTWGARGQFPHRGQREGWKMSLCLTWETRGFLSRRGEARADALRSWRWIAEAGRP